MARTNWLIPILLLAGCWLLGWIVVLPRVESELETAARNALASSTAARRLKNVTVEFSGQEAVLKGAVSQEPFRQLARRIVERELRLPALFGARLNAVTSVKNEIRIEPLPHGWMLLALAGDQVSLAGIAGSTIERDAIEAEVKRLFARPGVEVCSTVRVDDERAGECGDPYATAKPLSAVLKSSERDGAVFIARIGESWHHHQPAARDTLRDAVASLGATEEEWTRDLAPLVSAAEQTRDRLRLAAEEQARLAKLPPPHLILAMREKEVMLRGEVGTSAAKSRIIEAAVRFYREKRILDHIRVSAARRPNVDLTGLLENLPATGRADGDRKLAVGMPGHPWKTVILSGEDPPASVLAELPAGFDPALAVQDARAAVAWIQRPATAEPGKPLPYLALSIFADRVWLRGEVASEAARSQILDAARRMYPHHVLVHFVRLNAERSAADQVLETCKSFPPAPAADSPGIMAFALAGGAWQAATVTSAMFSMDGLVKAGIVPEEFAAETAYEEFEESIDALRAHLERLKPPAQR